MNVSQTDRRGFLRIGTASMLGLSLGDVLHREASAATPPAAKNVIMVWLAGGPATIDMWDMKPAAPSGIRGEFAAIDSSLDGLEVCEHLPQLAKVMHLGSVVRSVHHTLAAHAPGTELMLTGNHPTPALEYPSLGSVAARLLPPSEGVPTFMTVGEVEPRAGFLGAPFNPFPVRGPQRFVRNANAQATTVGLPDGFSADDLSRREALLSRFDQHFAQLDRSRMVDQLGQFQQQAVDILRSDKTRKALDLQQEDQKLREQYGFRALGTQLLMARRLIEAGVRFVTVGMPGWDTHGNNFGQMRTALLPELDQALASLLTDLKERGLLDSTVVYCTGEFGRTPHINGGAGRDHWARAMSVLLAGGPLRRGFVYGSTDARGYEPVDHPVTPMDVSATVLSTLGLSPEATLETPSGRPVAINHFGRPIEELLA